MSTLPDRDSPAWRERYNSLPGGVSLGSAPSEELAEELERLRAIEQRATAILVALNYTTSAHRVAREILDGEAE